MRRWLAAVVLPFVIGAARAQVPASRILHAEREPGNWLTYSGNYAGHRYSPLAEITPANIARLRVKWAYQFGTEGNEVSPIVVDGIMYISGPNTASALDARTGRTLWTWRRPVPSDYHNIGFGRVNRGPAILGDKLYIATLDCYLVALDLKTGAQRWATKVADYKFGYSMTLAPLAIPGKILLGVSGGETGIRGFVDAYDAATGKQAWRFYTIPAPGEPGSETWSGDAWKTGGGPTWVTGSFDPELNLVYWGVGNPSPDWNGDVRAGDNLYTCSVLALDAETGKLRWHFQFTPHDTHDWDASQIFVLFDAPVGGRMRKLIANANRNAFYYVLDRTTGEFIAARPFAKQTWARGLDAKGRPIPNPGSEPSEEGSLVWPNLNGGTVWFSPSYDPQTKLFYVAAREIGAKYFKREAEYKAGTFYAGGGEDELPADDAWGAIRALDPVTGAQRWEFKLHSPPWAGVLSTAGGVVFSGTDEGNFYALDARTGKFLWQFQTGANIGSNPISFQVDGRQCVSIAANRVLYVFSLP
jgi:alcohol dehydrogenase (cytochrome c)